MSRFGRKGGHFLSGLLEQGRNELFSLGAAVGGGGGTAVNTILIEGDSITELLVNTYEASKHSWQYHDYRVDKTIYVRAVQSRVIGAIGNLDDGGNELMGHVSEDAAFGPQLMTAMIGANDMGSNTDTTYRTNLTAYFGQLASRGIKFVWSPPLPYNPTGTPHPDYVNFTAQRANLMANARDPAVWANYADYYLPMGEIPDFGDPAVAAPLFGDTVHPSAAGQLLMFAVYKAAMDTILDVTANSTTPNSSVWPVNQTNLTPGATITERFIMKGIAHKGLAALMSVTGGGSPGLRLNSNSAGFVSSIGQGYNGDTIDLQYTLSGSNDTAISFDLTIGSVTRTITKRTVAAVTPAAYVHGGIQNKITTGTSFTTSAVAFSVGKGIFITNVNASAITINGAGPSGANVSATLAINQTGGANCRIWTADLPNAGSFTVTITYTSTNNCCISMGTVTGADPTPVATTSNATANQSDPHTLPSVTIPASGIFIGAFAENGGTSITPAVQNNGTFVGEANGTNTTTSSTVGLSVMKSSAGGPFVASWNFGFGTYPRAGLVFKALGT